MMLGRSLLICQLLLMRVKQHKRARPGFDRSARPRGPLNRGDLSCAEQWMLKGPRGSHLRGVKPKNQSRLWLRRCHRRQLPHTSGFQPPRADDPPPRGLRTRGSERLAFASGANHTLETRLEGRPSTLLGHSASHSERLFLPLSGHPRQVNWLITLICVHSANVSAPSAGVIR
jgi:hypothetical protein